MGAYRNPIQGDAKCISAGSSSSAVRRQPPWPCCRRGRRWRRLPTEAEDPFVCPVLTISDQAVANSGRFNSIGNGEYTFAPGAAGSAETFNGNVPDHATNADGAGSPGGSHSAPGDTDYTGQLAA